MFNQPLNLIFGAPHAFSQLVAIYSGLGLRTKYNQELGDAKRAPDTGSVCSFSSTVALYRGGGGILLVLEIVLKTIGDRCH
jgi:hypothetical protein